MIRRVLVSAILAAALIIAAGVFAWRLHVAAIASAVRTQATAARTIVAQGTPAPALLVRALLRPLVHVVIEDFDTNTLYDAMGDSVEERRLPPGGIPDMPGEPPRRPSPVRPGFGPPSAGQPPRGAPPRERTALMQMAGQLAHIAPQRIDAGSIVIHIAPNGRDQARFLGIDVLTCALLLLALGGFSTWLIVGISRAERAKLQAVADERRAAALEFQRFLADAGHELRTPLTIVSGYVDILRARDDATDPQLTTMLDGMRAETGRMRALVEKMLLLARLETPVAVPRLVDVAAVARDAAASMRAKFGERTLEVIDNDPASIVIDQDDLYEALHNLIENALKYAPDSPVRVYTGSSGRNAVVRVVDNGPGIPAGEREHVFRRFYRGNGRSDSDGSGLGLAIVVRVADRWNGNVQLDSTARETAFTLTFPLADEETHVVAG